MLKSLGADARSDVPCHVVLLEEGPGAVGALVGHVIRIMDFQVLAQIIKLGKLFLADSALEHLIVVLGGLVVDHELSEALRRLELCGRFVSLLLCCHGRFKRCVGLYEHHLR